MLKGIDISSWQGNIDLSKLSIDFVIVKASEGTNYINPYCDTKIQQAKNLGLKWGFYHYAKGGKPSEEAKYFIHNCTGYFNHGIPILDFEGYVLNYGSEWAKSFLDYVYENTGVRPLIYMSQSVTQQFDWRSVAEHYGLWVAKYPNVTNPNLDYEADFGASISPWEFMAMWQYASDGRIEGYAGNLDLNHFYGNGEQWDRYAGVKAITNYPSVPIKNVLENEKYKVEITEK